MTDSSNEATALGPKHIPTRDDAHVALHGVHAQPGHAGRPTYVRSGRAICSSRVGNGSVRERGSLHEAIQAQQDFSIEVGYSDLAGQQYAVSRFDIYFRSRAHWNWEVRQVHLQEPGTDEPFAASAPAA